MKMHVFHSFPLLSNLYQFSMLTKAYNAVVVDIVAESTLWLHKYYVREVISTLKVVFLP